MLLQAFFKWLEEQLSHLRDPAAKDQNGRVEYSQIICYRDAQIISRPFEGRNRQRVPCACRLCNLRSRDDSFAPK